MADWHCFKCKTKMEEKKDEIPVIYLDFDANVEVGLECPSCHTKYIEEEMATTKMMQAEEMLEEK